MAWTNTSKDIMSGTPSVALYAEYLTEVYPEIMQEAALTAAAQLQRVATERAKATPAWEKLASYVEVFADNGDIVLGTQNPAWADAMRTVEYGTGDEAPSPVLRTTLTSQLQPMGKTMQTVIDGWL